MNKQEISNIVLIEEPERSQLLAMKDVKLGLVFESDCWIEKISVGNNYFIANCASKDFLNKKSVTISYKSIVAEWFDSVGNKKAPLEIREATAEELEYICAVHGVDLFFKELIFRPKSNLNICYDKYNRYGFLCKGNFTPIPYIQGTNWVTKEGKEWSLESE